VRGSVFSTMFLHIKTIVSSSTLVVFLVWEVPNVCHVALNDLLL
jgi:hypothetical protein